MTSAMLVAGLFTLSAIVLLVGLGLGVYVLVRPREGSTRATSILSERFARGEISPEEYRERQSTLKGSSPRTRFPRSSLAMSFIGLGLVGMVASGAWAASSGWDWMSNLMDGDMGSMMSMMESGPTERAADPPERGAATMEVVSREFSFAPTEISLERGDTVNIEFVNEGHMFHTFTIPELEFDLRAQSGDSVAGALTPEEPGTYEFICAVPQHAEMGMRGRIVVRS